MDKNTNKGKDDGGKCLVNWGLDKVFTITVDNASANDGMMSYMYLMYIFQLLR